ncbi:MAG: metallophosphoesterase [Flexilinea sp.]|nr:metallophosphoesterase [Flexilinea sp.]
MSLFAVGDLHLHFQSELKAPGQLYGPVWQGHEEKFRDSCSRLIKDDDTLVLVGDHSWGKNLAACEEDFRFIKELPGRKILTRGNHDMFWDAKKTASLNRQFQPELTFLQDGYEVYRDYALVATKGHTFEGPFYLNRWGRIVGWDVEEEEHSKKLVARELTRLRASFEQAKGAGFRKFILFLHYPPTNILEERSGFTDIAEEFGVEQVIYAHSHGESRFHDSIEGTFCGRDYHLVSGDFLKWVPRKILD